jgi:pyruvate ferredoxin oxidoreductase alpha subunit
LRQAVKGVKTLIILDRCLSFGGPGGPVASEIRSALYGRPDAPRVVSFVGGLGGRDIMVKDFEKIVERGMEIAEKGSSNEFEIYGVRE